MRTMSAVCQLNDTCVRTDVYCSRVSACVARTEFININSVFRSSYKLDFRRENINLLWKIIIT